jgi:hypothetical protein
VPSSAALYFFSYLQIMNFFAHFILAVLVMVLAFVPSVSAAMSAGDVIALLLGLFLGILGVCACLGHYARSKGAGHW